MVICPEQNRQGCFGREGKEVHMHRTPISLLCTLVAAGNLLAAPTPFPKILRSPIPWVTGWDKPVDPVGGCRFDRKGDRLTITVPGKEHFLVVEKGQLDAPRLLRDVSGDFVVQVRVALRSPARKGYCAASILLTDGATIFWVELRNDGCYSVSWGLISEMARGYCSSNLPPGVPIYLRLERRGGDLTSKVSSDGKAWSQEHKWARFNFGRKLKVGVMAETFADGTFQAVFDEFSLSRP
jgi:regulation of enolase protein 1 (concanavalin A-like superfamily)